MTVSVIQTSFDRSRAERDTGYLARNVLGFNYDMSEETGKKVRPGGIRASGPHKQMIGLLDSSSQWKHLEAPRDSYKTSCILSYCCRRIIADRNTRILYISATGVETEKYAGALREMLEGEAVVETWGSFKGRKWKDDGFIVSGRTQGGIKDLTVTTAGVDGNVTGGHYDIVVLDDVVNWQNISENGLKKIKKFYSMVLPLVDPGCTLIVNGTRYHDDDLSGHILRNAAQDFEILILDSGYFPVEQEDGSWALEGSSTFAHLTKPYLEKRLRGMVGERRINSVRDYQSQYNNKIVGSGISLFKRSHFHFIQFEPWMEGMRAYLITDTATKMDEDGCFSVVGVVGLDTQNVGYLFDLDIGHWEPSAFEGHLLDMFENWMHRMEIAGVCMERTTLNNVFRSNIDRAARQRQLAIRYIETPRGGGEQNKIQRISGLSARFHRGDFYIVNTVPRLYQDIGQMHVLFDSEGYKDEEGRILPAGELVDEFIRFPGYGKRDIADALADIDMSDKAGQRLCKGGLSHPGRPGVPARPGGPDAVFAWQMWNGRRIPINLVPTEMQSGKRGGSLWKRLAARIPKQGRRF